MKQYKIKLNNLLKKIGFFEIFLTFLFLTMLFFLIFYLFRSKEWIIVDIKITSDNVIYENRTSPFWLTSSLKKGDTECTTKRPMLKLRFKPYIAKLKKNTLIIQKMFLLVLQ